MSAITRIEEREEREGRETGRPVRGNPRCGGWMDSLARRPIIINLNNQWKFFILSVAAVALLIGAQDTS
jgi:hypothetical protein